MRRALLVLLTPLEPAAVEESLLPPLAVLAQRYKVIIGSVDDPALDAEFLAGALAAGLTNLKGHRSVGGMRASIYNAMPLAGVQALVAYMQDFQRRHG